MRYYYQIKSRIRAKMEEQAPEPHKMTGIRNSVQNYANLKPQPYERLLGGCVRTALHIIIHGWRRTVARGEWLSAAAGRIKLLFGAAMLR